MKPEVKALAITLGIVGVLCLLGIPLAIIAANRPKREPAPLATEIVEKRKTDTNYSWKPFPSDRTYQGFGARVYARMLKDGDIHTFRQGVDGLQSIGDRYSVWCLAECLMAEDPKHGDIGYILRALKAIGKDAEDAIPAVQWKIEHLPADSQHQVGLQLTLKKIGG